MASDSKVVSEELDKMSDKLRQIRESQVDSGTIQYKRDGDLATVKFQYSKTQKKDTSSDI